MKYSFVLMHEKPQHLGGQRYIPEKQDIEALCYEEALQIVVTKYPNKRIYPYLEHGEQESMR